MEIPNIVGVEANVSTPEGVVLVTLFEILTSSSRCRIVRLYSLQYFIDATVRSHMPDPIELIPMLDGFDLDSRNLVEVEFGYLWVEPPTTSFGDRGVGEFDSLCPVVCPHRPFEKSGEEGEGEE